MSEVLPGATITDVQGERIPATSTTRRPSRDTWTWPPLLGLPQAVSRWSTSPVGGAARLTAQEYVESCPADVDDCQVTTLPDGTVVKSYSQVMADTPTGPWTLYRVERLVDGVVIGLNASAGRAEDEEGSVLAPNPPLTMEQLVDVAAHLQPLR